LIHFFAHFPFFFPGHFAPVLAALLLSRELFQFRFVFIDHFGKGMPGKFIAQGMFSDPFADACRLSQPCHRDLLVDKAFHQMIARRIARRGNQNGFSLLECLTNDLRQHPCFACSRRSMDQKNIFHA